MTSSSHRGNLQPSAKLLGREFTQGEVTVLTQKRFDCFSGLGGGGGVTGPSGGVQVSRIKVHRWGRSGVGDCRGDRRCRCCSGPLFKTRAELLIYRSVCRPAPPTQGHKLWMRNEASSESRGGGAESWGGARSRDALQRRKFKWHSSWTLPR